MAERKHSEVDRRPDDDLEAVKQLATLQRAVRRSESQSSELPSRPVQLPMWPEPMRGGPNALLRSALFSGIHSKKRKKLGIEPKTPDQEPEGVIVAAQEGIKLTFAGTQLNQYDADVFFESLHRARHHPLETECFFTGHSFLKAIGRATNDESYEDLHNSLRRLRNGAVDIAWSIGERRFRFVGSLISHYVREDTTKLYKVTFAKEIRSLFAPASWTQLEWDERLALKGKPLAQWLHSYFSTHAAPFPVSVKFLHEKTGSPTGLLKHFRVELRRAIEALENTLGWKQVWDGDLVSVVRPPSASQSRHLLKNAHKRKEKRAAKRANGKPRPIGELLPSFLKR